MVTNEMIKENKIIKNEDLIKSLSKKRQNKINNNVEKFINYFLAVIRDLSIIKLLYENSV